VAPEPTHDQLLAEIACKPMLNMTLPAKLNDILGPVVEDCKVIIDTVKAQCSEEIAKKIKDKIPKDLPKTMSRQALASNLLAIYFVMNLRRVSICPKFTSTVLL
jgi:hypothetical protein